MKRFNAFVATVALLSSLFVLSATPLQGQAATLTLYVSANGDDVNTGTQNAPLRTIGQAVSMAMTNKQQNISTTISIASGIYREAILLKGEANYASITIEAQDPGTVVISGSDIWVDWQPYNDHLYTNDGWTDDWGFSHNPWGVDMQPILQRREMVFVNGTLMRQVMNVGDLTEESFYVSEPENRIYVWPPQGVDINSAKVEVARRDVGLEVRDTNNITIRGLVFQHAASSIDGAALDIWTSQNIVVEDCQFMWNNWVGMEISRASDITLRNLTASYNGERGMGARWTENLLLENSESSYNNWRGVWANWYGWDAAGTKIFESTNITIRNYRAVNNDAFGLWFDWKIREVVIENSYFEHNFGGLFIEATYGPFTVRGSQFLRNRRSPEGWNGGGIFSTGSNNVTLENNVLANNEGTQLWIDSPERNVDNQTVRTENWVLRNNQFIGADGSQLLLKMPWYTTSTVTTMQLENNTFENPATSYVFAYNGSEFTDDFDGWTSRVMSISGSTFNGPEQVTVVENPTPVPNSMYYVSISGNANARACPRLDCAVIRSLSPGAEVPVASQVEGDTVSGSFVWYEVTLDSETAYMHSSLLSAN